jgi:TM2 domain-containing membrane protein YozV
LRPDTSSGDPRVDADFASEVLVDLYRYRRKNYVVAFVLWGVLGWVGAHRFYLERNGTGLLMLFTVGGGFLWWLVDAFLLGSMVKEYNDEQEYRERFGLPPLALSFMPPLSREVLDRPPEWTERWHAGGRLRRRLRFGGDVLVLVSTGLLLGVVASRFAVYEAIVPVLVLALLTAAGAGVGRLNRVPVLRTLVRWSHRLRLFYYFNKPGSPLALLFRPVTGAIMAPFRQRGRAEVRLYLQLGAVFAVLFLLEDLVSAVVEEGTAALAPMSLIRLWLVEVTTNFVVIYAFATPIGAVLTLYLLVRRTHTVPRILSGLVLGAVLLGMAI